MKNPLYYQQTEYDCGPTSMLNAVSFLFDREEIPPEILRNVMLYCLDCYSAEGAFGRSGTSYMAMMFLSNWLDGFGKVGKLPVSSRYPSGKDVNMGQNSLVMDALHRKGAVVLRLYFEDPHYVLLTGEKDGNILTFDPYYVDKPFPQKDILQIWDKPCACNRIVPVSYFEQETHEIYAMGEEKEREAVLLFNENTKLTPENTIEYFI